MEDRWWQRFLLDEGQLMRGRLLDGTVTMKLNWAFCEDTGSSWGPGQYMRMWADHEDVGRSWRYGQIMRTWAVHEGLGGAWGLGSSHRQSMRIKMVHEDMGWTRVVQEDVGSSWWLLRLMRMWVVHEDMGSSWGHGQLTRTWAVQGTQVMSNSQNASHKSAVNKAK